MRIATLPIKVYIDFIWDNKSDQKHFCIEMVAAKDYQAGCFPGANEVKLTVSEHMLIKQFHGMQKITWSEALAYFRKMREKRKAFWIEIWKGEITEVICNTSNQKRLRPELKYMVKVEQFSIKEKKFLRPDKS